MGELELALDYLFWTLSLRKKGCILFDIQEKAMNENIEWVGDII